MSVDVLGDAGENRPLCLHGQKHEEGHWLKIPGGSVFAASDSQPLFVHRGSALDPPMRSEGGGELGLEVLGA